MATVHLWTNHKQFTTKTMKKILFSLAAVAAMVGCAKDAPIADLQTKEAISINASIDLSDTRVTVGGDTFTDVKWEQGDNVTLASVAGTKATLSATEAGDNVRFEGEGSFVADTDTFYAIYPAVEIADGVSTFDLTVQSGSDAAILAAKAEGVAKGSIDMAFKPINALLHVAVEGATIAKAEFMAFDGAVLPQVFTYSFADGATQTTGDTTSYVIENPAAEGFFFSLPADLAMSAGYIVRLTDNDGKVCSKAYNGKTFAQGTTTRVNVEWSQPSVTLGTPMTSYSYYAQDNDASQANNCANNVIYFPNASSFAGVQKAMVTEAGVIVDGKEYKVDAVAKSFTPANVTVSTWGSHTVQAYIKTEGKTITSAPQTVHITGLPLTSTFIDTSSMPAYWNGANYSFSYISSTDSGNRDAFLRLKGAKEQSDRGYLYSNEFYTPSDINAQVVLDYKAYQSSNHDYSITIKASSSSVSNSSDGEYKVDFNNTLGTNFDKISDITDNLTLTTSTPRVLITHDASTYSSTAIWDYYLATAYVGVKTITVSYR